jgi:hypothetical protein
VSTVPAERPSTERLGAGRYLTAGSRPESTVTSVHELTTADGATVRGVLATVPGATTIVSLMHPRQDLTHHPLVPLLLRAGAAVWTQHTRSVNNDLSLVHEQALLDAAAGLAFLRDRGFASVVTLGHSGGGPLYAFYLEQAGLAAADRIAVTPGGCPAKLASAELPLADGAIFLAPRPGQGRLLLACIDPSVADEQDPMSVVPSSIRSARPTGSPSRRPARPTPPGSWPATGPRSATASPASTPSRVSTWPGRGRRAPRSRAAATRLTAAGRWPPRSSPCSAPTPTRAPSTCPWIPANGLTDRCSANAPTSSTTA